MPLQLPHIKLNRAQIYKIALVNPNPERLTNNGANFDPDRFDPTALPVQPNTELLTRMWSKLKQE